MVTSKQNNISTALGVGAEVDIFEERLNIALSVIFTRYEEKIFDRLYRYASKMLIMAEDWENYVSISINCAKDALRQFSEQGFLSLEFSPSGLSKEEKQEHFLSTVGRLKNVESIFDKMSSEVEQALIELCRTMVITTDDYMSANRKIFPVCINPELAYRTSIKDLILEIFNMIIWYAEKENKSEKQKTQNEHA